MTNQIKRISRFPVICVNCCEVAFSFNHELQSGDRIFLEYVKEHRMHCGNCGIPIECVEKSVSQSGRYWGIRCEAMAKYFPDPAIINSEKKN